MRIATDVVDADVDADDDADADADDMWNLCEPYYKEGAEHGLGQEEDCDWKKVHNWLFTIDLNLTFELIIYNWHFDCVKVKLALVPIGTSTSWALIFELCWHFNSRSNIIILDCFKLTFVPIGTSTSWTHLLPQLLPHNF